MKIGIDLDDTLCDTQSSIIFYQNIYLEDKNISVDTLWNNETYKLDFYNKYLINIFKEAKLKDDAYAVIKTLKNNGNKLYIITARNDRYIYNVYEEIRKYLVKNSIEVDTIIIDAGDKVDACRDNNIDVMIDNSKYNYDMLVHSHIKTILYDENEEYIEEKNRVSGWNGILEKIEEITRK